MSSNPRGPKYWLSAWWPVAVGVCIVLISSNPDFGADHTSGPLRLLFQAIFGHIPDARWNEIHFYIRKTGHFTGYGFIGVAWLRALWMTLPGSRYLPDAVLGLLGCATMASLDEWHQSYLPNRTGSPWDVLLDCTGALTAQLLVYIVLRLFRPARLAHMD